MGADSINTWIIIYRGYTPEKLAASEARLTEWLDNPYDAQTQGQKSYERQRSGFADQLAALQRVKNEAACPGDNVGVSDASGGIHGRDASANAGGGPGFDGYPNSTNW